MKNLIYLDVDKLQSLASQIFEGVSEYVVSETRRGSHASEEQKGPVGSGRVIGDILRLEENVSEKKYLIDHSYSLFEKKLLEDGLLRDLSGTGLSPSLGPVLNSFVRAKATVTFTDIRLVRTTISNFNKVGRALAHITSAAEIAAAKIELANVKGSSSSWKARESELKSILNLDCLAKSKGLYTDPEFLNDLALILEYGFQDQLEVRMSVGSGILSANLKRECLREAEDLLIRKYSRQTEVEFTMVGIVTQQMHSRARAMGEVEEGASMKEAIMAMVGHLGNVESTFTGRLDNETIIDPIALYTDIGPAAAA